MADGKNKKYSTFSKADSKELIRKNETKVLEDAIEKLKKKNEKLIKAVNAYSAAEIKKAEESDISDSSDDENKAPKSVLNSKLDRKQKTIKKLQKKNAQLGKTLNALEKTSQKTIEELEGSVKKLEKQISNFDKKEVERMASVDAYEKNEESFRKEKEKLNTTITNLKEDLQLARESEESADQDRVIKDKKITELTLNQTKLDQAQAALEENKNLEVKLTKAKNDLATNVNNIAELQSELERIKSAYGLLEKSQQHLMSQVNERNKPLEEQAERAMNNEYLEEEVKQQPEKVFVELSKELLNLCKSGSLVKKDFDALILKDADVNYKKDGDSILAQTVYKHGRSSISTLEAVKLLVENGASVDEQDKDGLPIIVMAAKKNEAEDLLGVILPQVKNINALDKDGKTALTYANNNQNDAAIKLLKNKGAIDPKKISELKKTIVALKLGKEKLQKEVNVLEEFAEESKRELKIWNDKIERLKTMNAAFSLDGAKGNISESKEIKQATLIIEELRASLKNSEERLSTAQAEASAFSKEIAQKKSIESKQESVSNTNLVGNSSQPNNQSNMFKMPGVFATLIRGLGGLGNKIVGLQSAIDSQNRNLEKLEKNNSERPGSRGEEKKEQPVNSGGNNTMNPLALMACYFMYDQINKLREENKDISKKSAGQIKALEEQVNKLVDAIKQKKVAGGVHGENKIVAKEEQNPVLSPSTLDVGSTGKAFASTITKEPENSDSKKKSVQFVSVDFKKGKDGTDKNGNRFQQWLDPRWLDDLSCSIVYVEDKDGNITTIAGDLANATIEFKASGKLHGVSMDVNNGHFENIKVGGKEVELDKDGNAPKNNGSIFAGGRAFSEAEETYYKKESGGNKEFQKEVSKDKGSNPSQGGSYINRTAKKTGSDPASSVVFK